ncbi:MAG: O-succinylbenzoic acid--CoA ligase [uncultured Nocardioidaceae bacterium]|uniref:O-succinylbenzoic acid--CoA ligase n=1 Tax=uncultured Nocardioidaceae bacterium TaxID=253824 RepID=A0A6J4MF49_9ACTN|nr:MAG: O-succinylbenzoic acid--CoA ligase [uncultured Nocardioidaceae bacterium]
MPSLRPLSGTAEELLALLGEWDAAADEPPPVVVATSGSTGLPKRVVLPRAALRASADATHARLGGPGQWALTVPPAYVAGLQVLVRSVRAGTVPTLGDAADPVPALLALDGPRRYAALVPTQLVRLLRDRAGTTALAGLDAVLVGGGPLHAQARARAEAAGVRVVATYGMSETCGGCVYDGVPLDGVGVKIDAAGQVLLAGPVLFEGYQDEPERTGAVLGDGWFATGDLGGLDADGRLQVTGRRDDVVISGGVKVPPVAVEEMLARHPWVLEVAVVGTPDEEWGERVTAVVRAAPGAVRPEAAELRALVEPRTWAPRDVVEVDEPLPVLPSGKPDRRALARLAVHR